ncbi:MAG: SDR family oxidoreductase [Dehalococcoidia bacterium]|nr:SDR family oxidoreductase [Dehalococcoidia bacterium]
MAEALQGLGAIVLGVETPAGEACARALAEAGAATGCLASRNDAEAALAARKLAKDLAAPSGTGAPAQAIDGGNGTAVQIAFHQVAKTLGRVDIVVCATDGPLDKPIARTTDVEWARLVAANLSSAFYATRAAMREMAEAGGVIILVTGRRDGSEAYRAIRTAVSTLAAELAAASGESGVSVHALKRRDDGSVDTTQLLALAGAARKA